MGIEVLGPLKVDGGREDLSRRDRVVLEALTVRRCEMVSLDQLAEALWGDRPPASSRKLVQGCVMRLRRALGAGAVETVGPGYRLGVAAEDVDADRFDRLVARARELMVLGEPERAGHLAEEALGLWRGPALVDVLDWSPGRIEAERLENLRMDAQEIAAEAAVRAGRHSDVLADLEALVQAQPLRERRWALLALAQYQSGRQSDALSTLRRVRGLLHRELGLDPGPDLADLERAVLAQDPSLLAGDAPPEPSDQCPYRGLVPYQVDDADAYHGRADEVQDCLDRLRRGAVLTVVGPSGSGKSSLVRAGVAARLRRSGRRVVVVVPGRRPTDCLSAVPTAGRPAVLVVDQCEEIFSLTGSATERREFLQALVRHAQQAPLVLCLRADRLAALSEHPPLARLAESGLYLLAPMGERGLRAAVEEPAQQAGLLLEPGLVDLLVREVEGEPGALPLLSHALRETWLRREGRVLTVEGYRATGGIRGAVAKSAEEVYERVPGDQRPLLRDLMLRLVTPGPEGEPVRSRVPRRLVVADDEHDRMVEMLVAARLVTLDEGSVELAHEALARAWPRLRGWLEDDSSGQRHLRHLSAAADAWQAMGRPDSELYRGNRLASSLEWRAAARPGLTGVESEFLDAGRRLTEREERSLLDRARRDRRANRRLRAVVAGLAAVVAVCVVVGILAVGQAERADRAANEADADRAGAEGLLTSEPDRALLLAVAGLRMHDSPSTRAHLLGVLTRTPQLARVAHGTGGGFFSAEASPNGRTVVTYDDENVLRAYDAATLRPRQTYDANVAGSRGDSVYAVAPLAFSPDATTLALGTVTGDPVPVRLLDTDDYRPARRQLGGLPALLSHVSDVAYSADGSVLAAAFDHFRRGSPDTVGTSVLAWDVAHPSRPIARLRATPGWGQLALSSNGDVLFVGGQGRGGPEITRTELRGHGRAARPAGPVLARYGQGPLQLDRAGRLLLTGDGNDVVLLDARSGDVVRRLGGHEDELTALRFSHDGRSVAAASLDRSVIVWDTRTGLVRDRLAVEARNLWGLGFSADDRTLYTAGLERYLQAWDLAGDRRFIPRVADAGAGSAGPYLEAAASPDGQRVAFIGESDGRSSLTVVDVRDGAVTGPVDTRHRVYGAFDWSPDSNRIATAGQDGWVRVWDPRTGRQTDGARVSPDHVSGVEYLPGGRSLVAGDRSGRVMTLGVDPVARTRIVTRLRGERVAWTFAGPDGDSALVFSGAPVSPPPGLTYVPERRWRVVDLDTGVRRGDVLPFDRVTYGDVSPDGSRLVAGSDDGEVVVLDAESGKPVRAGVPGGGSVVMSLSFGPTGSQFVSGEQAGTVSLWDAGTGDRIGTVAVDPTGGGAMPRLLADGHTVVIASADGQVYRWDLRPDGWIEAACRIAGRDLTGAEWRDAFGQRPFAPVCPQAG